MSFFNVPTPPKAASLDLLRRVNGGSQNPTGRGAENWSVLKEPDGGWTVRCCGDVMYGPATEDAAKAYFYSMTSK